LVRLHHHDEAGAKLEVPIPNVDRGPNGHVGNDKGGVVVEGLGYTWNSRWCGVTGSTIEGIAESLGVPSYFECSCSAGQNRSYTILFSSTIEENKQC
jgi:hypothetical protein